MVVIVDLCCRRHPLGSAALTPLGRIQQKPLAGNAKGGITPGEHWQIDFSELPKYNRFKHLLVLVDTFSGWPEDFSCHSSQAREVIKVLLIWP